ncbi:MAG TPA: hypothetical protein PK777_17305 [Thermoguttaceae bacterium]|nr:hypothetical protein [Thermoguttaceae bacterium]
MPGGTMASGRRENNGCDGVNGDRQIGIGDFFPDKWYNIPTCGLIGQFLPGILKRPRFRNR